MCEERVAGEKQALQSQPGQSTEAHVCPVCPSGLALLSGGAETPVQ